MVGKVVSHYKILEHLGSGGMGIVYKARDLRLDRLVALKFLPACLTNEPRARERFIREAKAASALQHHNICAIHDIEQTGDEQMFICMDFYEGETLKSKMEQDQGRCSRSAGDCQAARTRATRSPSAWNSTPGRQTGKHLHYESRGCQNPGLRSRKALRPDTGFARIFDCWNACLYVARANPGRERGSAYRRLVIWCRAVRIAGGSVAVHGRSPAGRHVLH